MESTRVLVGVREPLVREGLAAVLGRAGMECESCDDSAAELLSAVRRAPYDVVVMDADLNRRRPELIPSLHATTPGLGVLVRVEHDADECVVRSALRGPTSWSVTEEALPLVEECCLLALDRGARGCLPRGARPERVVAAVRALARGDVAADEWAVARWIGRQKALAQDATDAGRLTPREVEVTRLVADGLSNKAVASRLSVKEQTVKNHLASVMRKLGVQNRVEVALEARKRHLA